MQTSNLSTRPGFKAAEKSFELLKRVIKAVGIKAVAYDMGCHQSYIQDQQQASILYSHLGIPKINWLDRVVWFLHILADEGKKDEILQVLRWLSHRFDIACYPIPTESDREDVNTEFSATLSSMAQAVDEFSKITAPASEGGRKITPAERKAMSEKLFDLIAAGARFKDAIQEERT